MHHELVDVTLLFAVSLAVALSFHRLRLPPVVGFVVAGALLGPRSFGFVENEHLVEQLAEVGVVVLLFTVGLELASGPLGPLRRQILVAGSIQVGATVLLGAGASLLLGLSPGSALFLGFLLSLSSTAAITKLLGERGELASPPGRLAVAICVAQDIAVVPMILVLPLLAAGADGSASLTATLLDVAWTFIGLGLVALAAWFAVPLLLDAVSRTRSRELFVLAVVTVCLAMAMATGVLGLSLALGAFLAGLVLARGQHKHQAVAEVEPLRDALSSLFFVSIGMLFDGRVVLEQPLVVLASLTAVIGGKAMVAWLAARALRLPRWVALRGALMLSQVGEFSFVLVQAGRDAELLPPDMQRVFVVVAVLSIAVTPLLFRVGRVSSAPRPQDAVTDDEREVPAAAGLGGHVVLVGFGPAGRVLADAFDALSIPYKVIEMNAATVRDEQAKGRPIEFGDASRRAVLHAVAIERARLVVVAINDPRASRQVVAVVSAMAPHARVIVRAQFLTDIDGLRAAGADDVVPQELETSIEIAVRALRLLLVPDDVIGKRVREARNAFGSTRAAPDGGRGDSALGLAIPGLDLRVAQVEAGSEVVGPTLGEMGLRGRTGLTLVAIQHADGGAPTLEIGPQTRLEVGDRLVLVGPTDLMESGLSVLRSPRVSG